jgi:hypothetical protein
MTLCVFSLVASEFMPVSLLTPIAGALSVSEGMAFIGLLISLPSMPVAHRSGGSKQPFAVIALLARGGGLSGHDGNQSRADPWLLSNPRGHPLGDGSAGGRIDCL